MNTKIVFIPREPGEITSEDIFTLKFICSLPAVLGIAILIYSGFHVSSVFCAAIGVSITIISLAAWAPKKVAEVFVVRPKALEVRK